MPARARCTSVTGAPLISVFIAARPTSLSDAERQLALGVLNSEEFKNLAPSQIVPRLADQLQHGGALCEGAHLSSPSDFRTKAWNFF